MKTKTTRNITTNGLLIALVFISAKAINIPTAIGGVINLSDSIILTISLITTATNAAFIAGIGAFIAEFFSAYAIFSPATLVIKSLMAYISNKIYFSKIIKNNQVLMILAFVAAESIMIIGYFLYQAFVLNLGIATASLDIVNNLIQAGASIIIATLLFNIIKNFKFIKQI